MVSIQYVPDYTFKCSSSDGVGDDGDGRGGDGGGGYSGSGDSRTTQMCEISLMGGTWWKPNPITSTVR